MFALVTDSGCQETVWTEAVGPAALGIVRSGFDFREASHSGEEPHFGGFRRGETVVPESAEDEGEILLFGRLTREL